MLRVIALFLALAAVLPAAAAAAAPPVGPPTGVPAQAGPRVDPQNGSETADAYVLRIAGPLDAGHLALFQRGAGLARKADAALLLAFDTPGGAVTLMHGFAAAIDAEVQAGLRIYAFVDDKALSAGTWLAISCEAVYMRERAIIGASEVVQMGPGGMVPAPEKIASAFRAWVRGWAEEHGRSPLIAESMVDADTEVRRVKIDGLERLMSGVEWDDAVRKGNPPELIETIVPAGKLLTATGSEAVALGFADALAESVGEVLAKQGLAGAEVVELERSTAEDLVAKLHGMRLLLLFLGLFFGYIEMKAPGFGAPGLIGIGCIVLLFTGQYLVGLADVPHIVLASVGLALVAAELFVFPGLIWPALAGSLCLIAGLVLSQVGPGASFSTAWDREILIGVSFQLVATASIALGAIWAVSRFLPDTPVLGRLVLAGGDPTTADAMPEANSAEHAAHARVGAAGVAKTQLRPVGIVRLDGDPEGVEHEARAEAGLVEPGTRVRVVEVQAGRLVVEPDDAAAAAPGDRA